MLFTNKQSPRSYLRHAVVIGIIAATGLSPLNAAKSENTYFVYEEHHSDRITAAAYSLKTKATTPIIVAEDEASNFYPDSNTASEIILSTFSTSSAPEFNLYATSLKTGARTKLNSPLGENGNIVNFSTSANNKVVFYLADKEIDEEFAIYYTGTKASKPVKIPTDTNTSASITEYTLHTLPNGKGTVYTMQDKETWDEIMYLGMAKEPVSRRITPVNSEYIPRTRIAHISPRSKGILFYSDATEPYKYDLYYYDLKTHNSTKVNQSGQSFTSIRNAKIDPTGKYIYFTSDLNVAGKYELYRVTVTGTGHTLISESMPDDREVGQSFYFDAKGKTVYYTSDKDEKNIQTLYSVSLKKKIYTRLSDSGKHVYASAVDKIGNIYYEYFDNENYQSSIFKRAPKSTEGIQILNQNVPAGILIQLSISLQGINAFAMIIDTDYNYFEFIQNILTDETMELPSEIPQLEWGFLTPSIELEPSRYLPD